MNSCSLCCSPFGADLQQGEVVVLVHRQDIVEDQEVLRRRLSGAQVAQIDAAPLRGRPRPPVRHLADVVRVRACGVDRDPLGQPALVHQLAKNPVCRRRPADVAHADEEHRDAGLAPRTVISVLSCRDSRSAVLPASLHDAHRWRRRRRPPDAPVGFPADDGTHACAARGIPPDPGHEGLSERVDIALACANISAT